MFDITIYIVIYYDCRINYYDLNYIIENVNVRHVSKNAVNFAWLAVMAPLEKFELESINLIKW